MPISRSLLPAFALCSLLAAAVLAHDDDPKYLDRVPRYEGPGYRGVWAARPASRPTPPAGPAGGGMTGGSLTPGLPSGVGAGGPEGGSLADVMSPVAFPASGVELLSWVPLGEIDPVAITGNDCWGYVSPSGREYAIIGTSNGTGFVSLLLDGDRLVPAGAGVGVLRVAAIDRPRQRAAAVSAGRAEPLFLHLRPPARL